MAKTKTFIHDTLGIATIRSLTKDNERKDIFQRREIVLNSKDLEINEFIKNKKVVLINSFPYSYFRGETNAIMTVILYEDE